MSDAEILERAGDLGSSTCEEGATLIRPHSRRAPPDLPNCMENQSMQVVQPANRILQTMRELPCITYGLLRGPAGDHHHPTQGAEHDFQHPRQICDGLPLNVNTAKRLEPAIAAEPNRTTPFSFRRNRGGPVARSLCFAAPCERGDAQNPPFREDSRMRHQQDRSEKPSKRFAGHPASQQDNGRYTSTESCVGGCSHEIWL